MAGLPLLFLLGVGAAAGNVLPSDRAGSPCQPGTLWPATDGCNTCFCLENGVPGCSRMECPVSRPESSKASGDLGGENSMKPRPLPEATPYYANRNAQKPKPLPFPELQHEGARAYTADRAAEKPEQKPVEERSGVSCAEGEEWQEDCNSCFCLGDGKAACTMIGCPSKDRSMADAMEELCKQGDTWSDNCNVCHCVADGVAVCSYRTCAGEGSRRRQRRQSDCEPGTVSQVDCNSCVCLSDGRQACTRRFCLPASAPQTDRASSADCVNTCPVDCGAIRGEDGCLTCQCDGQPFFRERPVQETDSAAAAGDSWYNKDVDPDFAVNQGWMFS